MQDRWRSLAAGLRAGIGRAVVALRGGNTTAAALLQAVADASPDAIFAKDREGRYLLFNPEAAHAAGRPAQEVLGKLDADIFGREHADAIRRNDLRVMQLDRPETFEEELDTPAGRRIFLATKGPLHDGLGGVSGLYGIARDITDMVATRRRLADSEERYRRLFKLNPMPMWVHEQASGRFLAVNQAAEALYGYSREELLATTVEHLRVQAGDDRQHRCRDGRVIEVETFGTDIQVDGRQACLVLANDVTARRHAEAERRAASERFEKLFTAAPEPISLSGLDSGRFLQVNAAFCALFGHAEADVIGRTSAELGLWTQMEGREQIIAQLRAGGSVRDFEGIGRHRSGALIDVSFSAEKVEVAGSDCLLLVFRDITQHKRAEAALRHSEQRFRLAAAAGHVWEWDFGSGGATPSVEFFEHLGHAVSDPAQLVARFEAIVPPEDLGELRRHLARHLRRQGPYQVQFRARDAQGRLRWFETQGQAVWNEQGRATYMAGTTFEITERREAEQALIDSQAELFELAQRLLNQERDTHRRLAQSLHDRLGQSLAGARLHFDLLREQLGAPPPGVARPLERLSELLDLAISEVRSTLVALRPPLLERHGLAAALRMDLAGLRGERLGVEVTLAVDPAAESQRWPDDVEHAAFMIAREALANAQQHAHAAHVRVQLGGTSQQMLLSIKDDGIGIAEGLQHGRPGHLGIVGMRERALGIGGRLEMRPAAGGGTEVRLKWSQDGRAPASSELDRT